VILLDVNILVQLHREDADLHEPVATWLEQEIRQGTGIGVSELVLSGCLRVITHPKVFKDPSVLTKALEFIEDVRARDEVHILSPGPRHWAIFTKLCRQCDAQGNHVPDAYHAALAIEHGCEWASLDHGFKRFEGLKWRNPVSG
jgi:hypothetical protein